MGKNFKEIIYSMHPLERKVLPLIEYKIVSLISEKSGLSEAEVITGVQMLEAKGYLNIDRSEKSYIVLDKFGISFLEVGLPEIRLLNELFDGSKKMSQLSLTKEEVNASLGILKKEGLIEIKKDDEMVFTITENGKSYYLENSEKNPLELFKDGVDCDVLSEDLKLVYDSLSKRSGFLKKVSKKSFDISLTDSGKELLEVILRDYSDLDLVEVLSQDILKSGNWKGKNFRYYDINVDTSMPELGRRHPTMEANNILRDVFVEMGFKEMEGPMVESEFWNFDLLWIPQDHPARDEQDTFFLENVADLPGDLVEKVKNMHEKGLKRAHTNEGDWKKEISSRTVLRTHSTSTSFRTLADLGKRYQNGEDVNGKYFYVANNFRNEAVDATHLMELIQAEGFIVGDDLGLADLMGFVREYYLKLGIDQIKFKPTFNPYTEPSMEAHYYNPKLKKWYALINSGVFRQETLEPLGLGGKTVIAWGMGANRIAALLTGKTHVREITGATCDFDWLKKRSMMNKKIVNN